MRNDAANDQVFEVSGTLVPSAIANVKCDVAPVVHHAHVVPGEKIELDGQIMCKRQGEGTRSPDIVVDN